MQEIRLGNYNATHWGATNPAHPQLLTPAAILPLHHKSHPRAATKTSAAKINKKKLEGDESGCSG